MDSPLSAIDDGEVIADSEEEMDGMEQVHRSPLGYQQPVSSVSAFTATNHARVAVNDVSSISAFTAGPSYIFKASEIQKPSNPGAYSDHLHDQLNFAETPSIADRAKMRQRTQSKRTTSEVVELTDDDDDELNLKPSKKKAKPSPKQKQKAKAVDNDLNVSRPSTSKSTSPVDIVNTAMLEEKRERPRPRPRPIFRGPRKPLDSDPIPPHAYPFGRQPAVPLPRAPASSPPSHGPELPIATSPPRALTSQLPPSDPPNPTMTTTYEEEDSFASIYRAQKDKLPPIETLPQPDGDSDRDGRHSSPSSLFSEHSPAKKRKRTSKQKASDMDIDELVYTSPGLGNPLTYGFKKRQDDPRDMPPPPTFFAGSSSSSTGTQRPQAPVAALNPPVQDMLDLTDLPCTVDMAAKNVIPKKPSKKKNPVDDANFDFDQHGPPIVLDEDDGDGDFDPSMNGKKGSGKETAKEKKARERKEKAKEKRLTTKQQMEVVIPIKPTTTKTKAKGKGKETAIDKEAFKSREFIDDSDEEGAAVQSSAALLGAATGQEDRPQTPATEAPLTTAPSTSTSTIVIHSKKKAAISTPADYSSRTPASSSKDATSLSDTTSAPVTVAADSDMPQSKSKKRKSMVNAGIGEQEAIFQEEDDSAVKKKKGKKILLSDDDEDDYAGEEVVKVKPSGKDRSKGKVKQKETGKPTRKKPKKGSKVVLSEEDASDNPEVNAHMEEPRVQPEVRSEPEEKETPSAAKENITPALSSKPLATPKPMASSSRAPSVHPDGTTPLYARYEVAPRRSSLPMSEIIRRANSKPSSPFPSISTPALKSKGKATTTDSSTPGPSTPASISATYSPYMKSSRRFLSRIAPLHPNRRTPPPPPPPPPPKKKTKKELEMEEKWEEELVESVGGVDVWAAMEDAERKEMRKIKRDREMSGWED